MNEARPLPHCVYKRQCKEITALVGIFGVEFDRLYQYMQILQYLYCKIDTESWSPACYNSESPSLKE